MLGDVCVCVCVCVCGMCVSVYDTYSAHTYVHINVVTLHLSCHLQCGMYVARLLSVLLVFDCVLTLDLCIWLQ